MEKRIVDIEKLNYEIMENPAKVVLETEARFDAGVAHACSLIGKSGIALLAGPSSSGKTTTSLKIKAHLEKMGHTAYTISLDNFFVHRHQLKTLPNGKKDLESLDTLNIELLENTLMSLAEGRETPMPVYDFYTGNRQDDAYRLKLEPGDVAIIEGLHALNPKITEHITADITRLYVDFASNFYLGDSFALSWIDARFLRRMVRDSKFRGYPAINTTKVWDEVIAAEGKYIIPFAKTADVIIDTSFEYELNHLKPFALPLLEQISNDAEYGIYARQIAGVLGELAEFDGSLVPKTSLIREFTGGSEYADENGAV